MYSKIIGWFRLCKQSIKGKWNYKKNEKAKEKKLLFKIVNENKKIRERVANTRNVIKKKRSWIYHVSKKCISNKEGREKKTKQWNFTTKRVKNIEKFDNLSFITDMPKICQLREVLFW